MELQPFETAPKDGSNVVLLGRYGKATVARWADLNAADSEFGTVAHEPHWCWVRESDCKNDPTFVRLDWLEPIYWVGLPHVS